MGKSTAAAMFARAGVPVFDADAEVHRLQARGGALVAGIEARWPGTTGPDGVDRAKLGPIVLANRGELAALEALVHPAIARAQRGFIQRHRARPLVVLDIPLLFENGGWRRVGAVAVVSAPAWVQRRRVLARPGMTQAKFSAIRRLQTPDRVKRARADYRIDTGRPKSVMQRQILRIITCLSR